MEFGHVMWARPLKGAEDALDDEQRGFDIRYFGDNTCFTSDPFGELRDAARATSRIKLATGVTNTVTKHPSVIATSIAPSQIISGGRMICGLGKGDSAMGVIGRGPQKHDEFVANAKMLRTYLRGETQDINGWPSRLQWLDEFPDYKPVPLEITASGPKSIKAAAMIADRVTLAISADPERIDWALRIIDEGLAEAGRARSDIAVGMFAVFGISDDHDVVVEKLRLRTKGIAHMASFKGHDPSYQPEIQRKASETLRTEYDYRHHNSREGNPQASLISPELALWFGIGGSPDYAVERIGQMAEAGIEYLFTASMPPDEWDLFTTRVMPQAR